jgi:hypothetical protein
MDGELRESLARMKVPEPEDDEVFVVRVDATPLNPYRHAVRALASPQT